MIIAAADETTMTSDPPLPSRRAVPQLDPFGAGARQAHAVVSAVNTMHAHVGPRH